LLLCCLYKNASAPASVQAMADAARPACILETRKTAPGLRMVDKWAVSIPFFCVWPFHHF
jgi:nicotinate-nucleotide pyrophosphorylase